MNRPAKGNFSQRRKDLSPPRQNQQQGRERENWPHGYVDCSEAICRGTSVSAAVIQGVLQSPFQDGLRPGVPGDQEP